MPKLSEWIKWPGLVVGAVAALVLAANTVSRFTGAPAKLDAHISEERTVHDSLGKTDGEMHNHLERFEAIQRQQWQERATEQCMENAYKMLAAQKLLRACDSLGIDRRAGDIPPAELP